MNSVELTQNQNISIRQFWILFLSLIPLEIIALLVFNEFGSKYIFLAIISVVTLFFVLKDPFYGLLICFFIEFSGIVWGLEIPYGFITIVVLTGLGWLFDQTARLKFSVKLDVQYLWVIGLLIAVLLSSFPAHDPTKTLEHFLSYLKLVFFFFLIIQLTESKAHLKLIILTIVGATIFSLVFGIVGMFLPLPFLGPVEQGFRFRGLTSDPNIIAIHILIIFPFLVLYFFKEKRKLYKLLLAILIFISFVSLISTFSRSATIGFAVIIVLLLFTLRHNRTMMIIAIFAFLISLFFVPDMFWERLISLKNIYQDPSLRWRVQLFRGALDLFFKNPILGIGAGNFVLISHQFALEHLAVHNTFLEIAVETGFIGFFFYIGLVVSYLCRLYRSWKIFTELNNFYLGLFCQGLLIAFAGIFISSLFLSIDEYFVIWTLFGVGTILYQNSEKLKNINTTYNAI